MAETPDLSHVSELPDRRTGLIVAGVAVALLGCLCALVVPMLLLTVWFSQRMPELEAVSSTSMVPAILMYAGLAVALVWLGVGSMLARRWARALLLVGSWIGLVVGTLSLGMTAIVLPPAFNNPPAGSAHMPASFRLGMMIASMIFLTVIYVVIPVALVLFYRRADVRATCERRDPKPRWTDACPLPVLAVSLLLSSGALLLLLGLIAYRPTVPLFGRWVTGSPALAVFILTAAVLGWAGVAVFRLRRAGWLVAIVWALGASLSAAVTIAHEGLTRGYELMGIPPAQLAQVESLGVLEGVMPWAYLVVFTGVWLGYLIALRRYFRTAETPC